MLDTASHHDFGKAGLVYREIKQRITELYYQPGDRLSEVRIADELGVGRSPVRTAFARLQGEGWIEVSPQSGTFVRGLTPQEITEILETRLILETYMAGRAARRISDAELAKLRRAFADYGDLVSREKLNAYLDLDLQFHIAIYEAGGNSLIRGILTNLIDKLLWIRRQGTESPNRIQSALQEIQTIFAALEKRDAAGAGKAMRKHIQSSLDFRNFYQTASGKRSTRATAARPRTQAKVPRPRKQKVP
jgi:DNA-binding GntR family transcriptional regulator